MRPKTGRLLRHRQSLSLLVPFLVLSFCINLSAAFVAPKLVKPRCGIVRRATSSSAEAPISDLMREHDPILLFVSRLLPSDVAADASALYAWCRRLDEITDDEATKDTPHVTRSRLDDWENRFEMLWEGRPADEMDAALTDCLERNSGRLGREPFVDMLAGMRSDAVERRRVADRDELEEYAYQVAGTVGLMLLPLLNADMDRARDPAIALGKAIQLINILRDAAPDAALGRIYLPQDELKRNGVEENDVFALQSSEGYCAVVASVSQRASSLLSEAEAGRGTLPGPLGPLFVQLIVELYRGYLDELEKNGYDNLATGGGERVRISTSRKILSSLKAVQKLLPL